MLRYLTQRTLASLAVLFVIVSCTFFLIKLAPGGLSILTSPEMDPEVVARITANLGLDQPAHVQYMRWLSSVVKGDLGQSLIYNRPVLTMVMERLPATLLLTGGWGGSGPITVVSLSDAHREPVAAVDPAAHLCRVGAPTVLGVVDDPRVVELAWQRGVLGAAAQLIGLSRRMLEMTVEYVGSRTQFGVPVGSFQAVKHHLADALLQVEFAAPAVARAGFSLATDSPERDRDVSLAKALASEAARRVARTAIQCHGAIGYTTEYDLHLYAKRAWALAADWGSAAWHRARIARHLGLAHTGTLPVH